MPKIVTQEELSQREQTVIDAACELIAETGFAGLNMDRVVARVPYSKGAVYKHFGSAEELVLAITNSGVYHLLDLMQKAFAFEGSPRERYLARCFSYYLYSQLHPTQFFCELEALTPGVREKASQRRLEEGMGLFSEFKHRAEAFVVAGLNSGDLPSPGNDARVIANTSWSMEFGVCTYAMASYRNNQNLPRAERLALEQNLFWMVNVFLDGLGWQALSGDYDYQCTWKRLQNECFALEYATLNSKE